jgi:hypothetical protein
MKLKKPCDFINNLLSLLLYLACGSIIPSRDAPHEGCTTFFDADPIDPYAYHILAYDATRLVSCVRVYRLVSNGFSCVTEQILGEKTFSEILHKLGAQRAETVEIGRWIVHPAYRTSGRPAVQLAAPSAIARHYAWERFSGTARNCSVLSRDR